ncbi:MAG: hypothetical protein ACOYMN_03800 [Roseimicrobium sp.]
MWSLFRDDLCKNQVYARAMLRRHIQSFFLSSLITVATQAFTQTSEPPAASIPGKPKISPLSTAPDWTKLSELSGVLTREEFEQAIASIYTDGSKYPVPWRVEGDAVIIETTPGLAPVRLQFREFYKKAHAVARYWRTVAELPPLKPGEPVLKGLHIALDPGHIGGNWARMEERWLSMHPGEVVMEGGLVLSVAELLKPRLEALGAQVSLVRTGENPVTTLQPKDLFSAAREVLAEAGIAKPTESYTDPRDEARILTVQWQSEKLFYRVSEIRARARRVNEDLRPDLVLCLHLNAEAWGDPQKPEFVDKNHFHLLINGCYSAEELRFEDVRYDMLQRLFTKAYEQELAMAEPVANAMMRSTGLPAYAYVNSSSARRVSGNAAVYARNLLANRLYHCPVLYFEPYVMNHGQTYRRLLLGHYIGRTLLDGQLVSCPLEDYARGVVNGLVEYYKSARATH